MEWSGEVWRGYLSGPRCKWFVYGPTDVTATPSSLTPVKPGMVYLSGAGLPRLPRKETVKRIVVVVVAAAAAAATAAATAAVLVVVI